MLQIQGLEAKLQGMSLQIDREARDREVQEREREERLRREREAGISEMQEKLKKVKEEAEILREKLSMCEEARAASEEKLKEEREARVRAEDMASALKQKLRSTSSKLDEV